MGKKVYYAVFVTLFVWGAAFVGIRAALTDFDPGPLALFRYLIASAVMVPVYLCIKDKPPLQIKHVPAIVAFGILGFSIYNIALNIGEQTVTAGVSSFVVSQIPTVAILLATIALKERLTTKAWIGLFVSVLGVSIIAFSEKQLGGFNHGVWLLIIATVSAGIYSGLQKLICCYYHPLQLTTWFIWSGTAAMLGYFHPMVYQVAHASAHSIAWVIFLAVFSGAVGYACWTYVLTHTPAAKAASFLFAMPLSATLLGWLLIGEIPHWVPLFGGIVALSGAILIKTRST